MDDTLWQIEPLIYDAVNTVRFFTKSSFEWIRRVKNSVAII